MSANFDRAFVELLGHEGGYSNNPADPGGETIWGITVAVARENGYVSSMQAMDVSVAKSIYIKKYWLPEFDSLPYAVAFQVFDAAVNSGPWQAARWLQRSVHVADDGKIGPITLAAIAAAEPLGLVLLFNAERLTFLTNLSTWSSFGKGWARRVASNLQKGAA